jgi:hypothetical protein
MKFTLVCRVRVRVDRIHIQFLECLAQDFAFLNFKLRIHSTIRIQITTFMIDSSRKV